MADIKVKTTKKTSSVRKPIKVQKVKASDKPSAAVDDFMDEEDEVNSGEAECLLRSALNITKACYVQEDDEGDQEHDENTEGFQPVDRLMSSNIDNKISYYEKSMRVVEEDTQDYVVVGCRFPNGVVISLGKSKVLLRGINDMPDHEKEIHHGNVGFTKIIRPAWKVFLKTHRNWSPLLNGSIFVVSNTNNNMIA